MRTSADSVTLNYAATQRRPTFELSESTHYEKAGVARISNAGFTIRNGRCLKDSSKAGI
jgi:hypothetical protein